LASAAARILARSTFRLVKSCPRCSLQSSATPSVPRAARRHAPQPRQDDATVARVRLAETD
jgi:hypothetical protein